MPSFYSNMDNFKLNTFYSGLGVYVCSRCGFELFNSDAKVRDGESYWPVRFKQTSNQDSVITLPIDPKELTLIQPTSLSEKFQKKIFCGQCQVPLGYAFEEFGTSQKYIYDIPSPQQTIRFVKNTRCQVPLSFLF